MSALYKNKRYIQKRLSKKQHCNSFSFHLMTNNVINYSSHNLWTGIICIAFFQTYLIIVHDNVKDWIAFYHFLNFLSIPYTWGTVELKCDTILTDSCTRKPLIKKAQSSFNFLLINTNAHTVELSTFKCVHLES